jgi:hypothetical protein
MGFQGRRPPPRIIDVEARPRHETLYDVIVVPPTASSREIRKVARALRRHLPDTFALHDVCLAEQVLGRVDLRAEYDALLRRLEIAKQPMPKIGVAIEGARLGPSFATRVGSAGRASANAAGKALRSFLQFALALVVIFALIAVISSKSSPYDKFKIPDYKPIVLPRFEFDLKPYEYKPIVLPKLELPKVDLPTLEMPRPKPPKLKLHELKHLPDPLNQPVPNPPPPPSSVVPPSESSPDPDNLLPLPR